MSRKPKVLILKGDGINCEIETAEAFSMVGFETEIRHLNDLIAEAFDLDQVSKYFTTLVLPGGFSFGDELTSGRVLALKIQHSLKWDLNKFASRGGMVLGVCNGFQALVRMGIFGKEVSITANEDGKFLNRWVKLSPSGKKCVWLKGLGSLDLPARHGEGRIIFGGTNKKETMNKFRQLGMSCIRYEKNPNGSEDGVAGLCDSTGRVFGLMPHPEAFVRWTAHPEWTSQPNRAGGPGHGLAFFENAFREAKESV